MNWGKGKSFCNLRLRSEEEGTSLVVTVFMSTVLASVLSFFSVLALMLASLLAEAPMLASVLVRMLAKVMAEKPILASVLAEAPS